MAFAQVKGIAKNPKNYEVYQPKVITKEVIMKKLNKKPEPKKDTSWGAPGGGKKVKKNK